MHRPRQAASPRDLLAWVLLASLALLAWGAFLSSNVERPAPITWSFSSRPPPKEKARWPPAAGSPRTPLATTAPRSSPRVAWLFSGSTRTLGFPWTYRSLRTNGVDAFGGAADVFMFLRANESSDTGLKFSETGNPMGYGVMSAWDFPGIAEALAALQPVDLLLDNDTSPTVLNPACSWSVGNFMAPRYAGQMESWRKVFQLMQRAEVRGNFSYDWVVHARPDSALLAPLPHVSAWGSSRGKRFWFPYCAGDNCGPVSGSSQRPLPASFRARARAHARARTRPRAVASLPEACGLGICARPR